MHPKQSWWLSQASEAARHYGRHPELMTPFLLQALLGLALGWVTVQELARGAAGAEGLGGGFIALLSALALVFQGWALRWSYDALRGQAQPARALRVTLRRWVSLVGVSLLVSLPGGLVVLILLALTRGWIAVLGLTLTATLVNWITLFATLGVVAVPLRTRPAIREGFLLLGERVGRVLALFALLLVYGQLNGYLSGSNTLVSLVLGEDPAGDGLWSALSTAVAVLVSPWVYLLAVGFYREQPG